MGFLTGKKVLITGIASPKSIAYGIAEAMHRQGAELAFTFQGEKLKQRVLEYAAQWNSSLCFPCDVTRDEEIHSVMEQLQHHWQGLDCLIHSLGYAPAHELDGRIIEASTREGFQIAHDISSYSLIALAQTAYPLMKNRNASITTLTYLGAQRSLPNYNVMGLAKASLEAGVRYLAADLGIDGIRVNAVSAGPIRTLAALGIKNFRKMLDYAKMQNPLKRNISTEEVGNAVAFLSSDLASGITGQTIYVDAGFNITALPDMQTVGTLS